MKNLSFCCLDCKTIINLGESSVRNWLTQFKTIEEIENAPQNLKELKINQNYIQCLKEHKGHQYFTISMDDLEEEDNKLVLYDAYEKITILEGLDRYKREEK